MVAPSLLLWAAGCGSVKSDDQPDAGGGGGTADASIDAPPAMPTNASKSGTVAEGGNISLAGLLVTNDTDTAAGSLVYTVRSLPSKGMLTINDAAATIGQTFTQQDINDGKVKYVHAGNENTSDAFNWQLTDGVHSLPETAFSITVTPVNDIPSIVTNLATNVAEGGAQVITEAKLLVEDVEGNTPLTFTFLSITRGQLQKRPNASTAYAPLAPDATFTQDDIDNDHLRFVDPGTDDTNLRAQTNTMASFSWRVADADGATSPSTTGEHVTTFTVTSVDDAPAPTWRPQCNYAVNTASPARVLSALTDVDNVTSDYSICIVSITAGDSVVFSGTTTTVGTTISNIMPTVRNGAAAIGVNSCVPFNSISNITFTSTANRSGGSVTWKLMRGTTQFGNNAIVQFTPGTPNC